MYFYYKLIRSQNLNTSITIYIYIYLYIYIFKYITVSLVRWSVRFISKHYITLDNLFCPSWSCTTIYYIRLTSLCKTSLILVYTRSFCIVKLLNSIILKLNENLLFRNPTVDSQFRFLLNCQLLIGLRICRFPEFKKFSYHQ